jgi:hypothetical protein
MNATERFAMMLVAMVGNDELERMVEAQDEAHNPDDWGLDELMDEARTYYWEHYEGE